MVGQLEGQLQLQEGRLAVGGLHVHDDVGQGVEHHAVRTVLHLRRVGVGLVALLVALRLRRQLVAAARRRLRHAGTARPRSRRRPARRRADAGGDDDHQRQLLLAGALAFALGPPSDRPRRRRPRLVLGGSRPWTCPSPRARSPEPRCAPINRARLVKEWLLTPLNGCKSCREDCRRAAPVNLSMH